MRTCTRRTFFTLVAIGASAAALGVPGCARGTGAGGIGAAGSGVGGRASADAQVDGLLSVDLFAFDTFVTLRAACSGDVLSAMTDRCAYFESIFSRTRKESDVSAINAAGGKPVSVSFETADIIQKSLAYSEQTGGLFDISIGVVSELWDFKNGVVPSDQAIAQALPHVGYQGIVVNGQAVQLKDAQARIDLGGIAKGYVADDLVQYLVEQGCESACLDIGGTIRTIGNKPNGEPWRIGVRTSIDGAVAGAADDGVFGGDTDDSASGAAAGDGSWSNSASSGASSSGGSSSAASGSGSRDGENLVVVAGAEGLSVVTSGLTERAFVQDGKAYWHILDPRTGYPVDSRIASASIMSACALDGEGFTKPLFMMDPVDALAWIEAMPSVEAVLVGRDGQVITTSRVLI